MITKEIFALPDSALHEWITTNYNGSYSSSTLSFANTRSYHGIFCVRDSKTYDSWVLVNKVFEELVVNGESFSTDTNIYNGAVHPDGYRYLRDYTLLPYPVFTYSFGRLTVRKKFLFHPHKDLVVVSYEFPGIVPDEIRIFPLVSIRNFHSLIRSDSGNIRTTLSDGRLEIAARGMTFYFWGDFYLEPRGIWYYNFVYPEEMKRGISFSEDLYSCCTGLGKGVNVADLFISTGYETLKTDELEKMIEDSFNAPQVNGSPAACASKTSRLLLLKDDIIAGYHWFGPWTRDTMISMPGILLTAGKYDHALAILSKYRDLSRNGLLPKNLGNVQDYGAADASLWFIYAIFKYYEYTGDRYAVAKFVPAVEAILDSYVSGNDLFGADGPFVRTKRGALTWMDAVYNGVAYTPRTGLPVDVNALWYNALQTYRFLSGVVGRSPKDRLIDLILSFSENFQHRFIRNGNFLDVASPDDYSFRPNFILCFSLPFPCATNFSDYRGRIDRELLTPYGLRTLSPLDTNFKPYYWGDREQRDAAYHNGTVWPWLIGPYVSACRKAGVSREKLAEIIQPLLTLNYIPEVYDAVNPSIPRGCMMQAWSYGELLRVWWEDILGKERKVSLG